MATNLVSSVMQFLTPDMVSKIARTFGIDPDVAQKVVSAAVPVILASFAGLAAKPAGAQQLSQTLEQQRPDMLSQIASAIGGPDQKTIADTGSGMLSTLLGGGNLNGLSSAVGDFAGINQSAGKSVLGLIAPMVMGVLGQQQRSGGLDANGLANLLASQKDQIAAAMPPALASIMGARGTLDGMLGVIATSGKRKSRGRIPITVFASPPMRSVLPITSGSPLNSSCQPAQVRTTTLLWPLVASSGAKSRPRMG